MKTYLVGGAVRDTLLKLPIKDRDWVVVGATPQMMLDIGFQPIGRDFPVFLHPKTHEEYALARTERKTAKGYHGFAFFADPDVTLEQDLSRRDLTVNAIAQDADGNLTDPYHGHRDIEQKILRHVTLAFREDPVRILRVARFAARLTDFTIAPETMTLMRGMVANGETKALVAERVWQELARGLMEDKPSRMFEILAECGLLEQLLPDLMDFYKTPFALDLAAKHQYTLAVRYACLPLKTHSLKAPSDCLALAQIVQREQFAIAQTMKNSDAGVILQLLERCDAIRQPERFELVLQACGCLSEVDTGPLKASLIAALAVDTAPVAHAAMQAGLRHEKIGEQISKARVAAIAASLSSAGAQPSPMPSHAQAV